MKKVLLLDCTLRDGMYVTDFYTDDSIKSSVIKSLESASIDIIETGFLKNSEQKSDSAVYSSVTEISKYILPKSKKTLYAAIVMPLDESPDFPEKSNNTIDCIRLAFFKKDADRAISFAEEIKLKGYKVMLQPMRTSDYSNKEIINLITQANALLPYSFAVVDSFGNMTPPDVLKLYDVYDKYLDDKIKIGFHFHNNSQLAFANSIAVLLKESSRNIVLDSSVFGMGRGAGNLPTELIGDYLNTVNGCTKYDTNKIMDIYSNYFEDIFKKTPWGYSLKHYISARYNVNPFYATYISDKYGLTACQLDEVMSKMTDSEKISFDKSVAERLGRDVQQ